MLRAREPGGRRRRQAAATVALILAACAAAPSGALAGAGEVASSGPLGERGRSVREYWTKERMREAVPGSALVEGLAPGIAGPAAGSEDPTAQRGLLTIANQISNPAAHPYRTHGKVYMRFPGEGNFVCSGTAIHAPNERVVFTAGHCVFDAGFSDRFASKFMFVPGKKDDNNPYGRWTAKRLATTPGWKKHGHLSYDVGAAVMKRHNGRKLEDVVGARGIAFNRARQQTYDAYGYPAERLFFPGKRLWHCVSDKVADDNPPGGGPATMAIRCDMTGGSSGGGWVVGGDVLSVVSYGYDTEADRLYGPYFGGAVRDLFQAVRGKRR